MKGDELARRVRNWQAELRATAASLHAGAEAWRLSREAGAALPEEAQWIDPSSDFALPHAPIVKELAAHLEKVADDLDAPAEDAERFHA